MQELRGELFRLIGELLQDCGEVFGRVREERDELQLPEKFGVAGQSPGGERRRVAGVGGGVR
jgi:hypothetical protein